MTKYRDELTDLYGGEIGSVVGSGLDRLQREVSLNEQDLAVQFFRDNRDKINTYPIGSRRKIVTNYIVNGFRVPKYLLDKEPTVN